MISNVYGSSFKLKYVDVILKWHFAPKLHDLWTRYAYCWIYHV